MSQLFWKIENKGITSVAALTIFGATNKRDSEDKRIIGTFGSGTKLSITLLVRNNIIPVFFSNGVKMTFLTKPIDINGTTHENLFAHITGKDQNGKMLNYKENLNTTLAHGEKDWNDLNMAYREFVSNAIDACYSQDLPLISPNLTIELVGDYQVRAKSDYTRVFIPATPEANEYFNNIDKYFLHFNKSNLLNTQVIDKSNTDNPHSPAKLYRRGVFVRDMFPPYCHDKNTNALFDYNLDFELDESRNFSESEARDQAAIALGNSDSDIIAKYLISFTNNKKELFEHYLDQFSITYTGCHSTKTKQQITENWKNATHKAFGDNSVLCNPHTKESVERKGYNPVILPANLVEYLGSKEYNIKTDAKVLSPLEKKGLMLTPVTNDTQKIVDLIWNYLETNKRTNNKPKPVCHCFIKPTDASTTVLGISIENEIFINNDIAIGINQKLIAVVLEELSHYITGSNDCTRDFQDYAFNVATMALIDILNLN